MAIHFTIAPYETLAAKDGHLALCVGNDGQFVRLAAEFEDVELAVDARFTTNAHRVQSRDELVDVLDERHRTDTVDAWVACLNRIGIPAGRIGSIADAIDLAERLGLEPTAEVGEAPKQVRNPITFSRTPVTTYRAPPALGEYNDAVRRWLEEEGAR